MVTALHTSPLAGITTVEQIRESSFNIRETNRVASPSEKKPSSPFERRAMKVEIIGGLDELLSPATNDQLTMSAVGDGAGSGGGTGAVNVRH